jgi:transcriptional regulator with PAS, ATPase and Fis domain
MNGKVDFIALVWGSSANGSRRSIMVRTGLFREDLWFRLNVFSIIIPPLRQRTIDIPTLVDYFLEKKSMDLKIRKLPSLAPGAIEKLHTYDRPGNVRELENLVERTLILNQMMDDGSWRQVLAPDI